MEKSDIAKNALLGRSCYNYKFKGHKFIGGNFCGHDKFIQYGKNPHGKLRHTETFPEENVCTYWEDNK